MPLLDVSALEVTYQPRGSLFRRRQAFRAVRGVDLAVSEGETLGLVGESGSGKSTIGRAILRLVRPSAGAIEFDGIDVPAAGGSDLKRLHREVQVVFQDPYSSLNPSMLVGQALEEPLGFHLGLDDRQAGEAAEELLRQVGLPRDSGRRYPHEFSGGQRQRIAIARAIAARPRLVVCDEPVSALDVSTQGQIINLLQQLQADYGLAYLFIAHDLAVVRHISTRIAVLYAGRLMEVGPADRVYDEPAHPYTAALLTAIPVPDPVEQARRRRRRAELGARVATGEIPEPGCPFAPRCPHVMDVCWEVTPPLLEVDGGRLSACHLHTQTASVDLSIGSKPGAG